jgi:hypothetical protein
VNEGKILSAALAARMHPFALSSWLVSAAEKRVTVAFECVNEIRRDAHKKIA